MVNEKITINKHRLTNKQTKMKKEKLMETLYHKVVNVN